MRLACTERQYALRHIRTLFEHRDWLPHGKLNSHRTYAERQCALLHIRTQAMKQPFKTGFEVGRCILAVVNNFVANS